jgi:ATP-dependent Clp protease adaptor protein ClpS
MLARYLSTWERLREWGSSHYNDPHQYLPSWQGRASRLQPFGARDVAGDSDMANLRMSKAGGPGEVGGRKTDVITKTRPKTKKPSLYKVLILNDDYTPMEFVVFVLERFFSKGREEATRIMLHVHHKGVGVCGVFTYEVAETKVAQVVDFARQHQHPLQCTMEKE